MSTPDAAAAEEPQHVQLRKLTHEHVGALLTFKGSTGILDDIPASRHAPDDSYAFSLRPDGSPFSYALVGDGDATVEIVQAAPPSPHDDTANAAVKTPDHLLWAREMAEIDDAITAHNGEIEGLEKRYKELADRMMDYFTLAGDRKLSFDGRSAYLKPRSFPVYQERPASDGGGKFTNGDVVEALRAVGRSGNIKPESVNPQTLGAILREYEDKKEPVPEALARVVRLDRAYSVKITPPPRGRH